MPREIIILTLRDDDLKLQGIDPDKVDLEQLDKISDEITESVNDRWADDLKAAINTVLGDDLSGYELVEKTKFSTYLTNWQSLESGFVIYVRKVTFDSAAERSAYIQGAVECDRYGGEDFAFFSTFDKAMAKAKELKNSHPTEQKSDIEIKVDLK